jgi:hypothetical protein
VEGEVRRVKSSASNAFRQGAEGIHYVGAQMRGQKVSAVRRTIGNAFIVDFGKLMNYSVGSKFQQCGEWHLFVEVAYWNILKRREKFLTSDDKQQRIEEGIQHIKGRVLQSLKIMQE